MESPGLVDCLVDSGLVFCRVLDFPSLDLCFFFLCYLLPSPITTSPCPGWSLTLRDNPSSQVRVLSLFIVQALCEKFISFPVTSSLTAYSLLTPHTVSPKYKLRALGALLFICMCCWCLCGFFWSFPPMFYVFIENNFSYIIFWSQLLLPHVFSYPSYPPPPSNSSFFYLWKTNRENNEPQ